MLRKRPPHVVQRPLGHTIELLDPLSVLLIQPIHSPGYSTFLLRLHSLVPRRQSLLVLLQSPMLFRRGVYSVDRNITIGEILGQELVVSIIWLMKA